MSPDRSPGGDVVSGYFSRQPQQGMEFNLTRQPYRSAMDGGCACPVFRAQHGRQAVRDQKEGRRLVYRDPF